MDKRTQVANRIKFDVINLTRDTILANAKSNSNINMDLVIHAVMYAHKTYHNLDTDMSPEDFADLVDYFDRAVHSNISVSTTFDDNAEMNERNV